MALTLNGSANTIGGLAVGGLPDGTIAAADLASGAGGKFLQIVSSVKTDTWTKGTSTDWLDIDGTDQAGSGSIFCCKITPSAATSKVLVLTGVSLTVTYYGSARLVRDSTALAGGDAAGTRTQGTWAGGYSPTGIGPSLATAYLDSPSSTSELTYKVQGATPHSASYGLGVNVAMSGDADAAYITRPVSVITLIEVGA